MSSLTAQHEAELRTVQAMLAASVAEHKTVMQDLVSTHASELATLRAQRMEDQRLQREEVAGAVAAESGRLEELQAQMRDLMSLMQSTYNESKSSGPRMEGRHFDIFLTNHTYSMLIFKICICYFLQTCISDFCICLKKTPTRVAPIQMVAAMRAVIMCTLLLDMKRSAPTNRFILTIEGGMPSGPMTRTGKLREMEKE